MKSIITFLHMGGYAWFVWPSYGITAVILIVLLVSSLRFLKTREATLNALRGDGGSKKK